MKTSHLALIVFLIITLLLTWSLREVLIQIFAAIILAMALCSLTSKIKLLLSIPRLLALFLSILSILIISIVALLIIVPQFTNELQLLIIELPSAAKAIWSFCYEKINEISFLIDRNYGSSLLENSIVEELTLPIPEGSALVNGVTDSISKIVGFAGNVGIGIVQLIFVLSVSLMITVQPISYREVFILLIPSFYRRRARSILLICGEALTSWMFGVLISSTFVAFIAGIGLYALGVKLVIANALIAGFLNIIPNLGPTISTIFPMSIAFLDSPWKAIAVLILYIIIQNLESYVITPSIMHKQVKLLPGLAITAQFIFTIIFGPIGLLLALPLAIVIQVLLKEIVINDILERRENFLIN